MQLSDTAIREFQALYRARFGTELSEDDARETAERMVDLVKYLYELD